MCKEVTTEEVQVDDFLTVRFALDNVHPRELGETARDAFDRILRGQAAADPDVAEGRRNERPRGSSKRSRESEGRYGSPIDASAA